MLPEVNDLNNYERNMKYYAFIMVAVGWVESGTQLSDMYKDDLVELEDILQTEVEYAKARFWRPNPKPVALQNLGRIAALRSQGVID